MGASMTTLAASAAVVVLAPSGGAPVRLTSLVILRVGPPAFTDLVSVPKPRGLKD